MQELSEIFEQITQQNQLDNKFCFFVDGLDEYNGDESDITQLMETLSRSENIKMCMSSRPGREYENRLRRSDCSFDIAHFTKGDMRSYIDEHLKASQRWRNLAIHNPVCQEIIHKISSRAGGVWLWVSLVTKDIVKEANRNEDVATLRKIVDPIQLSKALDRISAHNHAKEDNNLYDGSFPDKGKSNKATTVLTEVLPTSSQQSTANGFNTPGSVEGHNPTGQATTTSLPDDQALSNAKSTATSAQQRELSINHGLSVPGGSSSTHPVRSPVSSDATAIPNNPTESVGNALQPSRPSAMSLDTNQSGQRLPRFSTILEIANRESTFVV
ncbi:hypothetical protein N7488_010770 [Penicillium malachiteum]|nr:hypothetical protein N7488_010770 [Penicillium malachiteum]